MNRFRLRSLPAKKFLLVATFIHAESKQINIFFLRFSINKRINVEDKLCIVMLKESGIQKIHKSVRHFETVM